MKTTQQELETAIFANPLSIERLYYIVLENPELDPSIFGNTLLLKVQLYIEVADEDSFQIKLNNLLLMNNKVTAMAAKSKQDRFLSQDVQDIFVF